MIVTATPTIETPTIVDACENDRFDWWEDAVGLLPRVSELLAEEMRRWPPAAHLMAADYLRYLADRLDEVLGRDEYEKTNGRFTNGDLSVEVCGRCGAEGEAYPRILYPACRAFPPCECKAAVLLRKWKRSRHYWRDEPGVETSLFVEPWARSCEPTEKLKRFLDKPAPWVEFE